MAARSVRRRHRGFPPSTQASYVYVRCFARRSKNFAINIHAQVKVSIALSIRVPIMSILVPPPSSFFEGWELMVDVMFVQVREKVQLQ